MAPAAVAPRSASDTSSQSSLSGPHGAGTSATRRRFFCAAVLAVHARGKTMADNKNDKGDKKSGSDKKSGQDSGKK